MTEAIGNNNVIAYSREQDETTGKLKTEFDLDQQSVDYLEKHLGAAINPHISTHKDYSRTVFYFKCCAIQKDTQNTASDTDFHIQDCFFNKEKADLLFENLYEYANESEAFMIEINQKMNNGEMPSEEDMIKLMNYEGATQGIRLLMQNDDLYSVFKNDEKIDFIADNVKTLRIISDRSNYQLPEEIIKSLSSEEQIQQSDVFANYGLANFTNDDNQRSRCNLAILKTASMKYISAYLEQNPDMESNLQKAYAKMVAMADFHISPYLSEDVSKEEYLKVFRQHPKAVRALSIIAKKNQEKGLPIQITSPDDLLKKCQTTAVIELADKIEFNSIKNSLTEASDIAQPMIGLGKPQISSVMTQKTPKVNEG